MLSSVDSSSPAMLVQQLMQLHSLLPALSNHVLETQQSCEQAVRALSLGGRGGEALAHRSTLASVIRARSGRARFMPGDWFSDPVWDMLLHLYEAHLDKRELTVGELAASTSTKPTTANRWLDLLGGRGWIIRRRCDKDNRRVFVTISESGARRMDSYIEWLAEA